MSFLAATILPACSSKQAAAIHPGACFGFDLTSESKSIRALLISPISASDLIATLSRDVRYPLGSTDVAIPEATPDTWSSLSDRILSRACPISTKLVKVPESAGVSNPPVACDARLGCTHVGQGLTWPTCCLASNELSYSVEARFPTITLSGTAQDLSKSLFLFFRVRLPTSGMLVHSSSVTAARPRLRSTNCCCNFGRSARCLASSASSRASL